MSGPHVRVDCNGMKCLLLCLQVEFESVKLELTHKEEELELMRAQLEEAGRLREIAEHQLDEALEALKEEREQKNSLRRELASINLNPFDSISHLEILDESHEGEKERNEEEMDSGYNNSKGMEKHRCSTPRNSDVFFRPQGPGLVSDLLSELHLSDSQKLKQQLIQVGEPVGILRTRTYFTSCVVSFISEFYYWIYLLCVKTNFLHCFAYI